MKKKILTVRILILLFFLIDILLIIKLTNGYISNLQVYSNIHLVTAMSWLFILLVFLNLLLSDTGFMKIGGVVGIITAAFTLAFQMTNPTSSYESITSDKYVLIIETLGAPDTGKILLYKKENPFFSKYIGSMSVATYYDSSYEIVGDSFIVTKCTVNSCITDEIDLE